MLVNQCVSNLPALEGASQGSTVLRILLHKKFKAPIASAAIRADELKVVVFNKSDIAWAESHQQMVPNTCKLYLQPEWDKREVTEKIIFDYVLKNPNWFVSLQTHKYLGVE